MLRHLFAVMTVVLLPVFTSAQCLTTLPPNPPFVPPAQYPPSESNGMFWYGTDALWTELSVEGKWTMRDNVLHGKGYRTKLIFWRRGFDWRKEPEPKLIITGKRLDGDGPSLAESHASAVFVSGRNAPGMMPPGMMIGIDIPTAGCWELTAHYGGYTLTFIVSVEGSRQRTVKVKSLVSTQ